MAEAAPGTECRQHMVSLAVSPPVPGVPARPQLRAQRREMPEGAAEPRAGPLLGTREGSTAWEGV